MRPTRNRGSVWPALLALGLLGLGTMSIVAASDSLLPPPRSEAGSRAPLVLSASTVEAPGPQAPAPAAGTSIDPRPTRCREGDTELGARFEALKADVTRVMEGYRGEWATALVDVACGAELAIRPDHLQYTASAGKIVPIIAALRAVEAERLTLASFEGPLRGVMRHSWDADADLINQMVAPEEVAEVLTLSGVSERTRFEHRWQHAFMPALDLARVWGALLDGRLLGQPLADYLLDLAAAPEFPAGLDTFPAAPAIPGYQAGQKAGYYVTGGLPYVILGAGYLRPVQISPELQSRLGARRARPHDPGVAFVFMARAMHPDLRESQRRAVYPLLVDYVTGAEKPPPARRSQP